jgi:predicted esterase
VAAASIELRKKGYLRYNGDTVLRRHVAEPPVRLYPMYLALLRQVRSARTVARRMVSPALLAMTACGAGGESPAHSPMARSASPVPSAPPQCPRVATSAAAHKWPVTDAPLFAPAPPPGSNDSTKGWGDETDAPHSRSELRALTLADATSPSSVRVATPANDALPASWPTVRPASAPSPWCAEGLTTLDERSCYILPPVPTRTLLIYLHGIVPPREESPEKTKVQGVILKAVQRAGVVAIVPRGRRGFGPLGRREWVGWPTTDGLYAKYAPELVAEFAAERKKLEALTGVTFSPVYLAGSSSGAYFVARLALHGGIDVDGFGAMSGGTGSETMELARLAPKPFYIGYGRYDDYVRRAIPTLVDVLNRAHWPIRVAEHPVDHGAREVYLEEAFSFWREQTR